jgi:hypothetical protein
MLKDLIMFVDLMVVDLTVVLLVIVGVVLFTHFTEVVVTLVLSVILDLVIRLDLVGRQLQKVQLILVIM